MRKSFYIVIPIALLLLIFLIPTANGSMDFNNQSRFSHLPGYDYTPSELLVLLQSGDPDIMRKIIYPDLLELLRLNEIQSRFRRYETEGRFTNRQIRSMMIVPTNQSARQAVIKSAIGGILNPDPRVRLVCMQIIRRAIPERDFITMADQYIKEIDFDEYDLDLTSERITSFIQEIATNLDDDTLFEATSNLLNPETVHIDYYSYHKLDLSVKSGNIFYELIKTVNFIFRNLTVQQIIDDVNDDTNDIFNDMSLETFKLLAEPIDNEGFCKIPINFLGPDHLIQMINGIDNNEDAYIKDTLTKSILRILRTEGYAIEIREALLDYIAGTDYLDMIITDITEEELNDIPYGDIIDAFTAKNGEIVTCSAPGSSYTYDDTYDAVDPASFQRIYMEADFLDTYPVHYGAEWVYTPDETEEVIDDANDEALEEASEELEDALNQMNEIMNEATNAEDLEETNEELEEAAQSIAEAVEEAIEQMNEALNEDEMDDIMDQMGSIDE